MGTRHLSSDEAALWARVMAGVRPLAKAAPTVPATGSKTARAAAPVPVAPPVTAPPAKRVVGRIPPPPVPKPARAAANSANTLDGTWDKQIARGLVSPDRTIDLHGHTLQSAYNELDGALDAAIGRHAGKRLVGKDPHRRGDPGRGPHDPAGHRKAAAPDQ